MSPLPCAYTFIGDKRLKVYFAVMTDITSDKPCGTVVNENDLTVVCGDKNVLDLPMFRERAESV